MVFKRVHNMEHIEILRTLSLNFKRTCSLDKNFSGPEIQQLSYQKIQPTSQKTPQWVHNSIQSAHPQSIQREGINIRNRETTQSKSFPSGGTAHDSSIQQKRISEMPRSALSKKGIVQKIHSFRQMYIIRIKKVLDHFEPAERRFWFVDSFLLFYTSFMFFFGI